MHSDKIQVFLTAVTVLLFINQASCNKPLQQLLENLFKDYEKGIRPNYGIKPVEVTISAYILAITDISEKDMRFTASMYFRESWNDPRLVYTPIPEINSPNGTIQLYGDRLNAVWEPDTFIVNEITSFQHEFGQPNVLVRLSPDGTVLKSIMYTITASCPMDLQFFPFDRQLCSVELESFASTARDISYKWKEGGSVGISSDVSTPTFRVHGYRTRTHMQSLSTGNYSRLATEILFIRSSGAYMLRYFFPMIIFVSISLLSLWGISPRTGAFVNFLNIGLITLFMAEGRSEKPGISYMTALDLYFFNCMIHIFLALIDCLVASFFEVRNNAAHEVIEMTPSHRSQTDDTANLCSDQPSFFRTKAVFSKFNLINMFIKVSIALLFLLTNIIYWSFYGSNSALEDHMSDIIPVAGY